ncbi:MAG: spore germination protein, partial [Clostridia bacterium]|nr:spore germination protein [Clostridia bacterium]
MFFSCQENIDFFKKRLNDNMDIVDKSFKIGNKKVAVMYIKSVINDHQLSDMIMSPLLSFKHSNISAQVIVSQIVNTASAEVIEDSQTADDDIITGILDGKVAIFIEKEKSCALIDIEESPSR